MLRPSGDHTSWFQSPECYQLGSGFEHPIHAMLGLESF